MRWWRWGDPLAHNSRHGMSVSDRFWDQVTKGDSCWEWLGSTSRGYGLFALATDDGRVTMQAHRFAYADLVGPIPEGLQLDHLCRNRRCVNPSHLDPCDNRTNSLRGFSASALNARKTHCIHGHELTEENTYRKPDGGRQCKPCRRETDRERRARRSGSATSPQRQPSC